jgi:hypothetical protein
MSELRRKSGKQVYLHSVSFRETDSYKGSSISFGLRVCGCKDKQKIWIWQIFLCGTAYLLHKIGIYK